MLLAARRSYRGERHRNATQFDKGLLPLKLSLVLDD